MPVYDNNGYPRDRGATDFQDSARLSGLMVLFKHDRAPRHLVKGYVIINNNHNYDYVRHPGEGNKYPFSRDQAVPLFAGLYAAHDMQFVNYNYKPQNDIISPSVRGHFIRCAGGNARWYQDIWLWLDVLFSCFIDPVAEPNQLVCLLMVHPNKKYLRFWCKWNKSWKISLQNYWYLNEGAWRGEPELAEIMIKKIEEVVR